VLAIPQGGGLRGRRPVRLAGTSENHDQGTGETVIPWRTRVQGATRALRHVVAAGEPAPVGCSEGFESLERAGARVGGR